MLYWAFIFFVISIVSGLLGLGGVAGLSMGIAKFLFIGFLVIALIFLVLAILGAKKLKNKL